MNAWLIINPIVAWLTAGLLGLYCLRTPADRIWHNIQFTTARAPYDPAQQRGFAGAVKLFGWFLLLIPNFATLMSLLVLAGMVSPAQYSVE